MIVRGVRNLVCDGERRGCLLWPERPVNATGGTWQHETHVSGCPVLGLDREHRPNRREYTGGRVQGRSHYRAVGNGPPILWSEPVSVVELVAASTLPPAAQRVLDDFAARFNTPATVLPWCTHADCPVHGPCHDGKPQRGERVVDVGSALAFVDRFTVLGPDGTPQELAKPLVPWTDHVAPEVMVRVFRENHFTAVMRDRVMQQSRALAEPGRRLGLAHDQVPEIADTLDPMVKLANRNARIEAFRRDQAARSEVEDEAARRAEMVTERAGTYNLLTGRRSEDAPRPARRAQGSQAFGLGNPGAQQAKPKTAKQKTDQAWRTLLVEVLRDEGMACWCCGAHHRHVSVEKHTGLVFGHLRPRVDGGGSGAKNLTVVCRRCDEDMGHADWRGRLPSVKDKLNSGELVLSPL